ncbi:MAG: hypothetical protein ACTSRZ_19970 [Promethearchaeota archaeon]
MKIAFYNTIKINTTYTFELLKYIAKYYKHSIVDIKDCDILCVSLTSHYEINELRKARKEYKNKIIVVGGHISNAPASLLAYADYVNLGQGFEFFRDVKKVSDIRDLPYVVCKNKRKGKYSHYINWDILPIVKISKYSYSYLESVGCKNKCKFCLTSWLNKYQTNPKEKTIVSLAERYKRKNAQFYLIGNNLERESCNLNVSDVTLNGYIKNPSKYKKVRLIRVGLESPSKKTRYFLGKRITNREVREFFKITKYFKKRVNIFMIAGFDTQEIWESFKEILGEDFDTSPKLNFIINYLDPSLATPLHNFDLTRLIPLNIPKIKRLWKIHNGRTMIFRDHSISWKNNVMDSLLQRCDETKTELILKLKKKTYNNFEEMIDILISNGLGEEIKGKKKYSIELENWHGRKLYS